MADVAMEWVRDQERGGKTERGRCIERETEIRREKLSELHLSCNVFNFVLQISLIKQFHFLLV